MSDMKGKHVMVNRATSPSQIALQLADMDAELNSCLP